MYKLCTPQDTPPGLSHRKAESGSWYPRTYLLGHLVLNLNPRPHGPRLIHLAHETYPNMREDHWIRLLVIDYIMVQCRVPCVRRNKSYKPCFRLPY